MNKYELLNILYAERNRLEKTYSRPGWTLWAIGAAIASLIWLLWEWAENSKDWSYAIIVFFLVYMAIMLIEACLFSFKTAFGVPIWRQGRRKDRVTALFNIVLFVGLILSQLFIISTSFHPWLYRVSISGIAFLVLLITGAYINSFRGYAVSGKHAKWAFLFALPLLPSFILFWMYVCDLDYNPTASRVGVIANAIVYLISLIPIEEKRLFFQIDKLISQVLYDTKEVNEVNVLQEMELYTIGLRYGRYLSKTKVAEFLEAIALLTHSTFQLIKMIEEGDESQIDKTIIEGQQNYLTLSKLSSSFLTQIKMTFRDEDIDTSLTPILKAGQVGVEAMLFWSKVCAIKNANPSDLSEQIDTAYNETVGRPEIQSLIADRELWLQK